MTLNRLDIHLKNLDHNYTVLRNRIKPNTQLIAVVKANAYGGGTVALAKRLVALGADYLAVAYTEEGATLRENGIQCPILVFYPQYEHLKSIIAHKLEPALYSKRIWTAFEKILQDLQLQDYPVHIKYNTGLNRIGFSETECNWILGQLPNRFFKIQSVYSHLSASEDHRPSAVCDTQIEIFLRIKSRHESISKTTKFHLLNSSGIFNYPEYQMNAVRAGIALHGYANRKSWDAELLPVCTLKSTITQLHQVPKGASVGYNSGWIAPCDSVIATLPLGHADGIGRHFGHSKGFVRIANQTAPIVGNVCMDMLMVNVTGIPCSEGDSVLFFGASSNGNDLAEQGGTIVYELLTGIGARVPRFIHYSE